ncbi:IMP dehydrogenase [Patescibacteria group bacterium]
MIKEGFTFEDLLLEPRFSEVRPANVNLQTKLSRRISLNVPIVSAAMDTVTEHTMAIALATSGGIGIIHKNLAPEIQAEEIERVKRWENGFIEDPKTLYPEDHVTAAVKIEREFGYTKIPITSKSGKLVGLLTNLDYFTPDDLTLPIKLKMTPVSKITVGHKGITLKEANKIIRAKKLSVLPITNKDGELVSMVTRKDLEKNEAFPLANKDSRKQLRVGGAISVGNEAIERAKILTAAGVDVLVVDVAHGHSAGVIETVKKLKKSPLFNNIDVIAGNIATNDGAKALIDAGADAIKIGVGPGSICTTRVIAGIGVPQMSAIMEATKARRAVRKNIPIIADGGMKYSGDIVKALAAGADSVMTGSLLAGTDEAPGEIEYDQGRTYKTFRGMGSINAMKLGSSDRYAQDDKKEGDQLISEGVEGRVIYRGSAYKQISQLCGGIRSGFAYIGAANIKHAHKQARFIRITNAGHKESHPHSIEIKKRPANY